MLPNQPFHFFGSANMFLSLQEIFGGNAVSDEYHIGRHVSNLFVTQTYEGQSDIHGQQMLSCRCHTWLMSLQHSYLDAPLLDYKPSVDVQRESSLVLRNKKRRSRSKSARYHRRNNRITLDGSTCSYLEVEARKEEAGLFSIWQSRYPAH